VRQFDFDIAILGGGLHGGLVAVALSRLERPPRILLVERSSALCGDRVWSCHATDVGAERGLLDSLPTTRWPYYDVLFPAVCRRLGIEYRSMHSSAFGEFIAERLQSVGGVVRTDIQTYITGDSRIDLNAVESASTELIVDARGIESGDGNCKRSGWQKFLGLEIEFEEPHGRRYPTVMDAFSGISQENGFHFVYTLPFSETRLLVEDTYYSEDPLLDDDECRREIHEYVDVRGWRINRIVREERGVLPIPFEGGSSPANSEAPAPIAVGWRGGWFHPTTGYSFGLGVKVAAAVARCWEISRGADRSELNRLAERVRRQGRFARRLNRLLFSAFSREDRRNVLERFHRVLSDDAVARFYAMETRMSDRLRLLVGRPPRGFSIRRLFAGRTDEGIL
jgi:lycopene beta-cyclase